MSSVLITWLIDNGLTEFGPGLVRARLVVIVLGWSHEIQSGILDSIPGVLDCHETWKRHFNLNSKECIGYIC